VIEPVSACVAAPTDLGAAPIVNEHSHAATAASLMIRLDEPVTTS
jgi:hypothetical protein